MKNKAYQGKLYLQRNLYPGPNEDTRCNVGGD